MTTTGQSEVDVLEQAKRISFANASSLQKANRVLENTLGMIGDPNPDGRHEVLSSDGILRTAGMGSLTNEALAQVTVDPTESADKVFADLKTKSIDSWMDVVKRSFRKAEPPIEFSTQAQKIIDDFLKDLTQPELNFQKLIDDLVAAKAYEEAKALHNYLHLGYLIVKQDKLDVEKGIPVSKRSQMGSQAVGLLVASHFAPLMGLGIDEQGLTNENRMAGVIKANLDKALNETNPRFSVSFDKKYPEAAKQLAQEYVNIPQQAPKVALAKKSDMDVTSLVKALIDLVTSPFKATFKKLFGKKKKAGSDVAASAPQSVNQVLPERQEHQPLPGVELLKKRSQGPAGRKPPTRNRQAKQASETLEKNQVNPESSAPTAIEVSSQPPKPERPPRPPRVVTEKPPMRPLPPTPGSPQEARADVMKIQREVQRFGGEHGGVVTERKKEFEQLRNADQPANKESKRPEPVILESEKPRTGMVDELKRKFEENKKEKEKGVDPDKDKPSTKM